MSFTTGLAIKYVFNWTTFCKANPDIAQVQGFEVYLAVATGIATL